MTGTVEKIYLSRSHRGQPQAVAPVRLEAGKGIVGDRYHSRSETLLAAGDEVQPNHISLISKNELDAFLDRRDSDIDYGDFRRNVVTSGIDLFTLIGKRFRLGTALCQGVEDCAPCAFLAATVHRAVLPELEKKAGLRAIILEDGGLDIGDAVTQVGDLE